MDSRIYDTIVLVAMLCAISFVSFVIGMWIYYMAITVYEIGLALEGNI